MFSGYTPNANKKQSLPGGRYFMDTNTTCSDACGNTHPLSVLIDNVNTSQVNESPGQGLLYSLLSSLTLFNPSDTVDLTSVCVPVSVYMNDYPNAGIVRGYIASTQVGLIDPRAQNNPHYIGQIVPTGSTGISGSSGSSGTSGPTGISGSSGTSGPTGSRGSSGTSGSSGSSGSSGTTGSGGTSNFCASLSCDTEDATLDMIIRTYLLALVVLTGCIMYRAIRRT